jgi:eukaryotic-like serine/threonine-protein kinase
MVVDPLGLVGSVIENRYRVDELVGEGGFGIVYRGFHLGFELPVAVKCLKIPAHFTVAAREQFWHRLREEGRLLAKLAHHPAIVRAYDLGTVANAQGMAIHYLVLEWLAGKDLEHTLEGRKRAWAAPYDEREAMLLVRPVLEAISLAHSQGIAHRDLKPANLFLADSISGVAIKVLDFGIAKAMQEGESVSQLASNTSSGFSAFSPQYGAPEQFRSNKFGPSGPWTDVHALGLVLSELVSGRRALGGTEPVELFAGALADVRPTPRECGARVSDAFEQLCAKALALEPKHRFPHAGALLEAVDRLLAGSPGVGATPGPSGGASSARAAADAAVATSDFLAGTPVGGPATPVDATKAATPLRLGAVPTPAELTKAAPPPGLGTPGAPFGVTAAVTAEPRFTEAGGSPAFTGPPATVRQTPTARGGSRKHLLWIGGIIGGVALGAAVSLAIWGGAGSSGRKGSASATTSARSGAPGAPGPSSPAPAGMVAVPASEFWMGSASTAANFNEDELPRHSVYLDGFFLDRLEVTAGQYQACVNARACSPPAMKDRDGCNFAVSGRDAHPVNCVTSAEADRYCRWAGKRLPTEAEWEKAARGTDERPYPWGNEPPTCERAVMHEGRDGCGRETTWPVGSKPLGASPYGALDMAGNVAEWAADEYDPHFYAVSPARNPVAQRAGGFHVARGGGCLLQSDLHAASRFHITPFRDDTGARIFIGFRCALAAP